MGNVSVRAIIITSRILCFEFSKPQVQRGKNVSFEIRKLKIMTELPTEDEKTIDASHDEALIIPVAEILYSGNRPWFTKNQIKTRLRKDYNQDVSNPTIDTRLDRLLERKRIGQTDIFYYLKGSSWPIPPDVRVESAKNELTVSDLINRTYIQWAGISVLSILIGGIMVWVGAAQASEALSLPFASTDIIAVGLLTFLVSYVLILLSIIVGLLDFAEEIALPDWLK